MSVEDEIHFLVGCKTFLSLQNDLLFKVKDVMENNYARLIDRKKFTYILTNPSLPPLIAKYFIRAMEQ